MRDEEGTGVGEVMGWIERKGRAEEERMLRREGPREGHCGEGQCIVAPSCSDERP